MSLITTSTFTGITDRAAAQYKLVKTAFDSISASGNGTYTQRVMGTDDVDVELTMLQSAHSIDASFSLTKCIRYGTPLCGVVSMCEGHLNYMGIVGGIDAYCSAYNVRVSDYFNQVYYADKTQYLYANNVFSEGDDLFGTVAIGPGPSIAFTDGVNYGNGSNSNRASGGVYAPTQLKVIVDAVGGGGATLLANLYLTLNVKDYLNQLTTIAVQIPSGTALNAEVDVGTSTSRFLDVTGVTFTGVTDRGTNGDSVLIYNKKERDISL